MREAVERLAAALEGEMALELDLGLRACVALIEHRDGRALPPCLREQLERYTPLEGFLAIARLFAVASENLTLDSLDDYNRQIREWATSPDGQRAIAWAIGRPIHALLPRFHAMPPVEVAGSHVRFASWPRWR
jgi:hypothetical protein